MSDFAKVPVGAGPVRIKYKTAEWSPQKNKLILKGLSWYCEQDPQQRGEEPDDAIFMMNAADVSEQVTNPLRVKLEWTGTKGQPPVTTMLQPTPDAEPVTPEQAKASGGSGKGGGRQPRLTLAQMDALHARALKGVIKLLGDQGLTEATVADMAAMAATRFIQYQDATDATEIPADEDTNQLPGAQPADDDIPF